MEIEEVRGVGGQKSNGLGRIYISARQRDGKVRVSSHSDEYAIDLTPTQAIKFSMMIRDLADALLNEVK